MVSFYYKRNKSYKNSYNALTDARMNQEGVSTNNGVW